MAKLLFQGHGSLRFMSDSGQVVFVDPFVGEGYDAPADLILVTHQHVDHNNTELCTQKPGCKIITNSEALAGGKYNSFDIDGINVQAVAAYNKNHGVEKCVGYIITIDGIKVYCSGDTSRTAEMEDFAAMNLDYAILCGDGQFNMSMDEAADCAELIGAKHNIIIHTSPGLFHVDHLKGIKKWLSSFFPKGKLYDAEKTAAWKGPNKLVLPAGEEIELVAG